jgi:hypothetical protein
MGFLFKPAKPKIATYGPPDRPYEIYAKDRSVFINKPLAAEHVQSYGQDYEADLTAALKLTTIDTFWPLLTGESKKKHMINEYGNVVKGFLPFDYKSISKEDIEIVKGDDGHISLIVTAPDDQEMPDFYMGLRVQAES